MGLVAFSPSPSTTHQFERVILELSATFSTVGADDLGAAMANALKEIATAFVADECLFIDLREPTRPSLVASWAIEARQGEHDLASMPWLLQRLARNAVVATTPTTDVPHAAAKDREYAQRAGIAARLAVPVAIGARVAFGLMVGSRRRHAQWEPLVIERLRLAGQILGNGIVRQQQEETLRAQRAELERRNGVVTAEPPQPSQPAQLARGDADTGQIIGESAAIRAALARLAHVAAIDATVLLLGETGTGKELFARALHDRSRRRDRTLVRVNCAALPASLIESELFGHERGAFTGAVSRRLGRFELADGGTIFLDEIGDLASELQAKLLRVLQEGEFERVGSSHTTRVNVRVIAGTHVDLEKAVADGRFRSDLYYRLSVFPITLPPLRARSEDIPQMVWHFIHQRQQDLGRCITSVPADVMDLLKNHDWPGNVRELENVIERAMIRSTDGILQLDDRLNTHRRQSVEPASHDSLDAVQRCHIERVLRECGWRINGAGNAAVRLGIHPNTLRFRLKKLGVVIPSQRPMHPRVPAS